MESLVVSNKATKDTSPALELKAASIINDVEA